MKLNAIFAAGVLAMASLSAAAATTAWGVHDPAEFGFGSAVGAGSVINDTYSFTLSAAASILGVGVSNDGGIFNLTGGTVTLFMDSNPTPIGSFSFDSTAVNHSFGLLAVGSYHYIVSGTVASDAFAGTYQLNSQLAPVPEPESYALMLAGLGAVAFIARRRKKV